MKITYDTIIIGAGACGMISAITSAKNGKKVLLLEKLSSVGAKLKATGGGRCNLTNTLDDETFIASFGKHGRFMNDALREFNHQDTIEFFESIGVKTSSRDGFRVFPDSHNSTTVIEALKKALRELEVEIKCNQHVQKLLVSDGKIEGIETQDSSFKSRSVVLSTGGKGYPSLGTTGDGYELVSLFGHTTTKIYPAMTPLKVKESWVQNCRADTIAKVKMVIDIKKYKKLDMIGDLIFTKDGIRGPVVLDFAREITPLLDSHGEVPILINLTKGLNQEQIREKFNQDPTLSTLEQLNLLLPKSLSHEFCKMVGANPEVRLKQLSGKVRDELIRLLAWTPLRVTNHEGFDKAMITRGGIKLKEIEPKSMQSRLIDGLYFCGEVVDIDGPCGGYNLQWAFSSGYLAGLLR